MKDDVLIELVDGSLATKPRPDLQSDDVRVFDGPAAFTSVTDLQAQLEAEIAAAGGLEAWREANKYRYS